MPTEPLSEMSLDALTSKQREVLDLLIQHKTSKEISRILGISPYTVDQRILLARGKLQVASRSEVAQAYRVLLEQERAETLSGKPVYRSPEVARTPEIGEVGDEEQMPVEVWAGRDEGDGDDVAPSAPAPMAETGHHVLPEVFDGPQGTLLRIGAMALLAMLLVLTVLGGLTIFLQLSRIVDR